MAPIKRTRLNNEPPLKKRKRKTLHELSANKPWGKRKCSEIKYDPEHTPDLARKFCLLGATNIRLAELFDVDLSTIIAWKETFPAFKQALYDGRDKANALVTDSVFHRAMGYDTEEKVYQRQPIYATELNGDGTTKEVLTGYEMVLMKTTVKHVPADAGMAAMFLSNRTRRKPVEEKWTNRQELTGADGAPLMPVEQSDEQAKEKRAALLATVGVLCGS